MYNFFEKTTLINFVSEFWGEKIYFTGCVHDSIKNIITWDLLKNILQNPKLFNQLNVLLRSTSYNISKKQPESFNDVLVGLDQGLTLQVRNFERVLEPDSYFYKLVKEFENTILHPLSSMTLFYSLPHSIPTAIHKDMGEIFSFQLSGKKHWKIAYEKHMGEQMSFNENEFTEYQNFVIEAGQFIYFPSNLPHQVKCIEEPSLSVAFVFNSIKYESILWLLKDNAELKYELDKPLPFLSDGGRFGIDKTNHFLKLLKEKIEHLDSTNLLRGISSDMQAHIQSRRKK